MGLVRQLIWGLVFSSHGAGQSPETPSLDEPCVEGELGARIHGYLRGAEAFGFSGVVLALRSGELVLHHGYGRADRRSTTPMTIETRFDIGSIAKSMTAATALRVASSQDLSLSDPVSSGTPDREPMSVSLPTLEQLLRHRGGVRRNHGLGTGLTSDQVRRAILESDSIAPPGTMQRYSNAGYTWVATLLEERGGWRDHLRSTFEAARLQSTSVYGHGGKNPIARNYLERDDVGSAEDWEFDWSETGNGHVLSTAADLARWIHALEVGQVVNPDSLERMRTVSSEGDTYGMGLEVGRDPLAGAWYGHSGDYLGYHALLRRFPESDTTLVICCNEGFGFAGLGNHRAVQDPLIRILFGEEPSSEYPSVIPNGGLGEAEAGLYRIDEHNTLALELEGGMGWIVPTGPKATAALFNWGAEEQRTSQAAWNRTQAVLDAVRADDGSKLTHLLGSSSRANDLAPWCEGCEVELLTALPVTWSSTPIIRVFLRSTNAEGTSTVLNLGWRRGHELYDVTVWDHESPHAVRIGVQADSQLVICDYWTRRSRTIRVGPGRLILESASGETVATRVHSR